MNISTNLHLIRRSNFWEVLQFGLVRFIFISTKSVTKVSEQNIVQPVFAALAVVSGLWFFAFSPLVPVHEAYFWEMIIASAVVMLGIAHVFQSHERERLFYADIKLITIGFLFAALLYAGTWCSAWVLRQLVPPIEEYIRSLYAVRFQTSPPVILVALFLIAPAEELFWRGFVQNRLMRRYGEWNGIVLMSVMYAAVHLWAWNPLLIAAAFFFGLFWGWCFLKFDSLVPNLISHLCWDILLFIIAPL
jgi:uncharacterized protein